MSCRDEEEDGRKYGILSCLMVRDPCPASGPLFVHPLIIMTVGFPSVMMIPLSSPESPHRPSRQDDEIDGTFLPAVRDDLRRDHAGHLISREPRTQTGRKACTQTHTLSRLTKGSLRHCLPDLTQDMCTH